MKPGRGRLKGNAFERKVAADICAAFGMPAKQCYRTPLSGGHPYGDTGDLVVGPRLAKRFPYLVECKHRRNWNVEDLFTGSANLCLWLSSVAGRAKQAGRWPLLVVRGNRTLTIAVYAHLRSSALAELAHYAQLQLAPMPGKYLQVWHALEWKTFLRLACPEGSARGNAVGAL